MPNRPPRQANLTQFERSDDRDDRGAAVGLEELTDAEREVYVKVERGNLGPRELARETDRSPGTIGNLLSRARSKVGGEDRGR